MLIYNHKKEFLGMDESDLRALGLSNMREFENEASDIADLFVKSPGYIHNFKHVHWIDYVTCNDTAAESKVIINVQGRTYSASIDIKTFYLLKDPAEKGYVVTLLNIKALSAAQAGKIPAETPQAPKATPPAAPLKEEAPLYKTTYDPYETDEELESLEDIQTEQKKPEISFDEISKEEDEFEAPRTFLEKEPQEPFAVPQEEEEHFEDEEQNHFAGYIYDPKTASEDLGLPIDLVEEFVQDFIAQAQSFREGLYDSVNNEDFDNLKIQSHKLKGVAANLRIEDALDALTKINTLQDPAQIKMNLDRFYKIINKLENKNLVIEDTKDVKNEKEENDDMLVLSFKEEKLQDKPVPAIDDSLVPDSIEIPELADDEFLNSDINSQKNLSMMHDFPLLESEEDEKFSFDYDKKRIAHEMGLGEENFNELLHDYLSDTQELAASMLANIQNGDIKACKESAAKIKGMSQNMRIHEFDEDIRSIMASSDPQDIGSLTRNIISKADLILKSVEDK